MNGLTEIGAPQISARERQKSLMLRTWVLTGLFFMALPGTLLGFSNLMAISAQHGAGALPAAWMEGHGHAQMFGWIGSFILGIGFYSQPGKGRGANRLALACYVLWTLGVGARWFANIYGWEWRVLLPLSAGMELVAVALFLRAAADHKLPEGEAHVRPRQARPRVELWMTSVLAGTAGLTASVIFNFVECVRLAVTGTAINFPHGLDQRYLVLLGWGFLTPMVWGFSARWLHAFLGIRQPNARWMGLALGLDLLGVVCGVSGWARMATALLAMGTVVIGMALGLWARLEHKARVLGIHASFPLFVRLSYVWLMIAGAMSVWAASADAHGGIWGAGRHALTVGFAATMVFAIGPRILPHFSGVQALFSKRLMLVSLLLLQAGCTLRVASEPLAYEGLWAGAWKTLPVSGMVELSAVLVFALNLGLTLTIGKRIGAEAIRLAAQAAD